MKDLVRFGLWMGPLMVAFPLANSEKSEYG